MERLHSQALILERFQKRLCEVSSNSNLAFQMSIKILSHRSLNMRQLKDCLSLKYLIILGSEISKRSITFQNQRLPLLPKSLNKMRKRRLRRQQPQLLLLWPLKRLLKNRNRPNSRLKRKLNDLRRSARLRLKRKCKNKEKRRNSNELNKNASSRKSKSKSVRRRRKRKGPKLWHL